MTRPAYHCFLPSRLAKQPEPVQFWLAWGAGAVLGPILCVALMLDIGGALMSLLESLQGLGKSPQSRSSNHKKTAPDGSRCFPNGENANVPNGSGRSWGNPIEVNPCRGEADRRSDGNWGTFQGSGWNLNQREAVIGNWRPPGGNKDKEVQNLSLLFVCAQCL